VLQVFLGHFNTGVSSRLPKMPRERFPLIKVDPTNFNLQIAWFDRPFLLQLVQGLINPALFMQ
jgi:hypothetical protein